jgi:CRISPR/Cas system-associated protein Csx1
MTKFCSPCKQDKPISEFAKNARKKDGLQTCCKSCQAKYGQIRYQNTKEAYRERNNKLRIRNQIAVHEYLKLHPCVDCSIADTVVLTFDHVRGVKRATVSDMAKQSLSLKVIFDEIAKCEVRCFNCHMIKDSFSRGGKKWKALNELG